MKIKSSNDIHGSVVWKVGDIVVMIKEMDSNFEFIKARDNEVLASSRQQMSKELEDLKDEWMHFTGGTFF